MTTNITTQANQAIAEGKNVLLIGKETSMLVFNPQTVKENFTRILEEASWDRPTPGRTYMFLDKGNFYIFDNTKNENS